MKIFVRNLPPDTSPKALQDFAEDRLTPPWYLPMRSKVTLKNCTVLKIKDLETNTLELHGLLEVMPCRSAMEAIKRLNRASFHSRLLEARKWHERSHRNDKRRFAVDTGEQIEKDEHRKGDRRRAHLHIEPYEPTRLRFEGLRQFHREYRLS